MKPTKRKEVELRLIAELTLDATLASESKLLKLAERAGARRTEARRYDDLRVTN